MRWLLSPHARGKLARRGIPLPVVLEVVTQPEQIVPERDTLRAYHSRIMWDDGRAFLLRVIVDDTIQPAVVVAAYRTSKVEKYWREDEDLL
ncbi:MAG: DUF4258 domain-containing protein [Actinobacteria bacterium]|nr:DUF4258 domain-containing protein [Actinomycetota bacterium]